MTTPQMTVREKYLYHQIHPVKLAADISASAVSTWLIWRHHVLLGMLSAFLPAIAASAVMMRWMGFERQRDSALGRYVAFHMTHVAEAVRFGGQIVMWVGAWYHAAWAIPAGVVVVLFGWMYSIPAWLRRGA